MSATTCQNLRLQDAPVASPTNQPNTHRRNINIIDVIRAVAHTSYEEDMPDKDVAQILAQNMDAIMGDAEGGQSVFTREVIEQMLKFLADNGIVPDDNMKGDESQTGPTCRKKHRQPWIKRKKINGPRNLTYESIEQWLGLLEQLVEACQAYSRIDRYLQSLSRTRPGFSSARTLLLMLHSLPKVPRPGWQNPFPLKLPNGQVSDPHRIYFQVMHTIVRLTNGVLLFPNDIIRYFSNDTKTFCNTVDVQKVLTEEQRSRLDRSMKFFTEAYSVVGYNREDAKVPRKVQVNRAEDNARVPETEPVPLMRVLETYHVVSRLADFYRPYPGSEFAQAQVILRDLRRELQKEVNRIVIQTDFEKYLSEEK